MKISRRSFFAASSLGAATMLGVSAFSLEANALPSPPICVFSKHLQFLGYEALAETVKDLGLDGVDLTVRDGGHVLPERVEEDLPKAVEALRAQGMEAHMITTRFENAEDAYIRPVLQTASALGIRYFRIGGHHYNDQDDPMKTLDTVTKDLRGLAQLAEEYGMVAGYHNHSGYNNVGAPLWDLKLVFDRINSKHLGSNFDLGHATVEGSYGDWQITSRVMAPYTKMVAVKDFQWRRDKPEWVSLGKGIVHTSDMLKILLGEGFQGPISLHFEYRIKDNEALLDEIRDAVKLLRQDLDKAGYSS